MPDERLSRVRVDELDTAARRMIGTALRLQPGQKLVILSDRATSRLGDAVARAGFGAGGRVVMIWLDEEGERPMQALPETVVRELELADASVFVASAPHAELMMRQHLLHLVNTLSLRHAHMPGISTLAFARGMRVDYDEVAKRGRRLLAPLQRARSIAVSSPAGTLLRVYLAPSTEWFPQLGEIPFGRWGNLPAGALFATPESVHGTFVADASLGEYFGRYQEGLAQTPVRFTIQEGRVTQVSTTEMDLKRDVETILAFGPNSDRIGLVAVGVNYGIREPSGEAIVDQNVPGLHICIGDPAARVTGASWGARTSFAACQARATVSIDGEVVIREGQLVEPS